MAIYDIAFYFVSFFLIGVFLESFKINLPIIVLMAGFGSVIFLLIKYLKTDSGNKLIWLSVLSMAIILGAFYSDSYNNQLIQKTKIIFDKSIVFSGIVSQNPEKGNLQKLIVDLQNPYGGKILIKIRNYPAYNYGDLVKLEGIIKKPEPKNYADYLAKNRVFGVSDFPKNQLISQNQGFLLKSFLYGFKNQIILNFQKVLGFEEAAFLSGITLGERAEFPKEFKEAMSNSGTTHLVALSGYNISIITLAVAGMLAWFLSRRWTFIITILVILSFVLMTGAEASVVRAAIMGIILLLANQVGRVYSLRNAISIAAFLMVLENPKVLLFDIGFQLSFLALLGIAYLKPTIQNLFRLHEKDSGFLSWRDNLLTTFSAQLAVAPMLILQFGNFSLISLLANVLILGVIPITMAVGFIIGFLGFISYYLSLIGAWFLSFLLNYEIFIINFFGNLNILKINYLSIYWTIFYYLALIVITIFFYKKRHNKKR